MRRIVINPSYGELTEFIHALPASFEFQGEVIFQGRNVLKRFRTGGRSLIVKRFRRPHWINRFVYVTLRASKAARSYRNGMRLEEWGIRTPAPVAYIEERYCGLTDSYYITLEERGMREIRCFCPGYWKGEPLEVLDAFGEYSARLHQRGVLHKDYSPGNILFDSESGRIEFSLVDINRMRFGPVTEEEGYQNLSRLWFDNASYQRVAYAYAREAGIAPEHAWERIRWYKDKFMR